MKIDEMKKGDYLDAAINAVQKPNKNTMGYLGELMEAAGDTEASMIGDLTDDLNPDYESKGD